MDTHNIDICPIEWYGYALKSVRDISRICEEEMRESNHMRDITHLYPISIANALEVLQFCTEPSKRTTRVNSVRNSEDSLSDASVSLSHVFCAFGRWNWSSWTV